MNGIISNKKDFFIFKIINKAVSTRHTAPYELLLNGKKMKNKLKRVMKNHLNIMRHLHIWENL